MKLRTLIKLLMKTKILPARVDKDGKIEIDVFNTTTLVYTLLYLSSAAVFIYRY